MIKNLRFLFLALLTVVCGQTFAYQVSWDWTAASYDANTSSDSVQWSSESVIMVLEKGKSTTGANNYLGGSGTYTHTRVYKDQILSFTPLNGNFITSIEIEATDASYGGKFTSATWTNATCANNGAKVTITPTDSSKVVSCVFTAATRANKVVVKYKNSAGEDGGDIPEPTPTIEQITVAQARAIINTLADNGKTAVEYAVEGYIVGTPDFQRNGSNVLYGNVNLNIADEVGGTTTLAVYRGNSFNGEKFDEETIKLVKEGDKVIFQGTLQRYMKNNEVNPQIASGGKLIMHNGQDHFDVQAAELTTAASVKDFLALTVGTEATLTLTNAQITYVNVNNNKTDLFIREGDAAIDLFDLGIEAKVGDILNGTINVKLGANSGFVAAVKGTNELNSTVQVTDSAAVQPLEFTDFTEAKEYYCHLLIATNVTVNNNGNILDGDQVELTIYDRFKNGLQDKLKKHKDDGKAFNVTGLMYNGGDNYGPEFVIVDATFADGSEITDKPIELIGNGTKENPYLISDLLQLNTTILDQYTDSVWVKGVIVGSINGAKQNAIVDSIASNLALATEAGITEFAKVIPVELKNNSIFRTNLNVKDNATNIGKEIMLFGLIQSYFSTVGIKGVSDYILDGVQYRLNVTELKAQNRYNGAIYNLRGQRIITPGKGLYIKDGKKYFVK